MTHRVVISSAQTLPLTLTSDEPPEFKVTVEYRPADSLTASQIGNELARVQRLMSRIIDGSPD